MSPSVANSVINIWKAAGQQSRLEGGMLALYQILCNLFPLGKMTIGRLYPKLGYLESLLNVGVEGIEEKSPQQTCNAETISQITGCFQQNQILTEEIPQGLFALFPHEQSEILIFCPITKNETSCTFFIFSVTPPFVLKDHQTVLWESAQAIDAILARESEYRKLLQQREAAEADKQAALKKLGRQNVVETLVGAEHGLKSVLERIELIHQSSTPVLLMGESGTGKELIARTIHLRSPRAELPFLRINCGAVNPDLINLYLFGQEKSGKTTQETVPGWVERTDGGTLFLDDIHDLPLSTQLRLLQVIEQGQLERIGGEKSVFVDVRVIAATDQDLGLLVSESRFREPLWYKLAVFPVRLPTLRERPEDLPELAEHFARRAATRFGLPVILPNAEQIKLLQSYPWPGNVRELGAVMDRAAILGNGRKLDISAALGFSTTCHVPSFISNKQRANRWSQFQSIEPLDEILKRYLEYVLEITGGKIEGKDGAAALLEINANTLRARMKKLGLDWKMYKKN